MVEPWTETMTARERVETIATTLSTPRTTNWVAEEADVKWDTAKKHLDDLTDSGILLRTEDNQYVPDPSRVYLDHLRDLILTNDQEQLRGELEAIAERIDDWRATYDVESIEDLEATLAEDLAPDQIRERRRVLRQWKKVTIYERSSKPPSRSMIVCDCSPRILLQPSLAKVPGE